MTRNATGSGKRRWRRYALAAIVLLIALWTAEWIVQIVRLRDEAALSHLAGLRSEVLLDPETLRALPPLDADFDVASDGSVLFASGGRLYETMPDSGATVELPLPAKLQSFAFDRGGALLTVSEGFLGRVDAEGRIVSGVPLPEGEARLSPSLHPGATYLIAAYREGSRLYRFLDDGSYQALLESDQPLIAAADDRDHVYAATGGMIVRLADPKPIVVFKVPDGAAWGPIRSLTAGEDGLLLFSTRDKIFALRDGVALSIVNDSGGALRMRDGRAYSLAPISSAMFRGER
jgi:hypothetical protein